MKGFSVEPGRAQRPGHVDPAGAAGVEIVGRANLAQNFAGHGVGQHHGHRHARADSAALRRARQPPGPPERSCATRELVAGLCEASA